MPCSTISLSHHGAFSRRQENLFWGSIDNCRRLVWYENCRRPSGDCCESFNRSRPARKKSFNGALFQVAQRPAILKGWVDRVFAAERVYSRGKWFDNGAFAGKRAIVFLTTGGGADTYETDGLLGDLHHIHYPINHGILRLVGFDVLPPFVSWPPGHLSDQDRRSELHRYRATLKAIEEIEPVKYPSLDEYDARLILKVPVAN